MYSEEKYGNDPFLNLFARIRSTYLKYFIYVSIFVLLHNAFLELGIIINAPYYSGTEIVRNICNSATYACTETMGAALWFVPVLIFASGLFGTTVWFGRKAGEIFKKVYLKYLTIIILSCFFGAVGIYLNLKAEALLYHLHTSFLVVPIFTGAYFLKTFCKNLKSILKWYVAIPLLFFMLIAKQIGWNIELSVEQIVGPLRFYLISFSGIYVCLYLAKLILYISPLRRCFRLIGRYSYEIMAFHFLTTKTIDVIYATLIGQHDKSVYGVFVSAYAN